MNDIKMYDKKIIKKLKEIDKVSKKAKRAKKIYIKSLTKSLKIGLLTLTEVKLSNNKHLEELPNIINQLDEILKDAQELIKDYRNYVE